MESKQFNFCFTKFYHLARLEESRYMIHVIVTQLSVLQMIMKIIGELALVGAIASVFIVAAQGRAEERAAEEAAGRLYMRTLDEMTSRMKNRKTLAAWDYQSNITDYNQERQVTFLNSSVRHY